VRNVDNVFRNTKISLPVKKDREIDFAFMEGFISQLEACRLSQLEAYLLVTGLKNYTLTPAEEQALTDFQNGKVKWGEFNLENLYGKSTRGKRLKSADRINGDLPFVTAGEAETGVSAFIGNDVEIFAANTTTIDMFGSAKYRNYEYGGDDHIAVVHTEKINKLKDQRDIALKVLYEDLTDYQRVIVSRHPERPYTLDYIENITTDFIELHGDRLFRDDPAIVGGLCKIDGKRFMIIGHQKGRTTKEKVKRNFGMPAPEGYRKALRLMEMAERFNLPIITFIDTPGAYPGIGAEERGQAEAIARNLREMSQLKVPVICTVIGEGGSGGALAIGVGDKVNMLQYSTYSVISPEGCASILWKSAEKASTAAEVMGLTAQRLKELNLIDSIIAEPLGGAHRDYVSMAENLKTQILADLAELDTLDQEALLARRYERLMSYGYC